MVIGDELSKSSNSPMISNSNNDSSDSSEKENDSS